MGIETGIVYRIDDQDVITYVNEEWDRFANANNGRSLMSHRVLNRSLWEFIQDAPTRGLYRQVLKRIRDGRCVRFHLRCDAPGVRRVLAMDIVGSENGGAQFHSRILSAEPRTPVAVPGTGTDSKELLRVCGWCNKVFIGGHWEEIEDAVEKLQLLQRSIVPALSHGICDPCYVAVKETLTDH
ncbi:hypothetical protein [Frigoriglobus tundricola]|uniref:Histidine ammonia-lyase n=1 Tax=Frigoriglobus tundricola TaxID=2774151 RepID=A0A6M5YRD8_9BACT|nr:hypothetical protein [Frigoriglobus tundricola]QJW96538.1 Histidine ammonia-lyase [Frigoriglobus tundricola]